MIINAICDECGESVATRVVKETKWTQIAMCEDCHDEVDHEAVYECRLLWPNIVDGMKQLVVNSPDATTADLVNFAVSHVSVPVFLPPFESTLRDALRDRSCFRAIKVQGSRALRYEVAGEEES